MTPDELLALMHRRPFVPFRIHVSDGSFYDVRHPDGMLLTRRAAHIAVPPDDPIPERALIVSLLHVTRVEDMPAAAAAGGNSK